MHWPGSSWPPTSDSENLFVIDGTSPGALGMATSQTEKEFVVMASDKVNNPGFHNNADPNVVAICLVEELTESVKTESWNVGDSAGFLDKMCICDDFSEKHSIPKIDLVQSYVKEPSGWAIELPEGAKESLEKLGSVLYRYIC